MPHSYSYHYSPQQQTKQSKLVNYRQLSPTPPPLLSHHQHHHHHFNEPVRSFNIVHEILCDQDLSRAGNLFTMSNDILLANFPTTLEILKSIIDSRKYAYNLNEQSLVEIVLTKCISALRETKMIANYYTDLLDIIEICMKYSLSNNRLSFRQTNNENSAGIDGVSSCIYSGVDSDCNKQVVNTPHANIVSDILSTILLVSDCLFYFNSVKLLMI